MTGGDTPPGQDNILPGQPPGWRVYVRAHMFDRFVTLVATAPCGMEVDLGQVSPLQSMLATEIEVDWAAVAERVAPT